MNNEIQKRNEFIGLDIGSSAIKAVKLVETDTGIQLVDHGCVRFSELVIKNGKIVDRSAVKEALESLKFLFPDEKHPENICVSIPGCSTSTRFVRLPDFSFSEFNRLLQSEAQIYCDPGNFTFSAKLLNERPIGSYEKGDKAKNEILLLMAGKEMLSEYSQVLREAGIHNVNYSVDILASIKSAELWLMKHAESCDKTAIIHIGAQTTNISIIRAGILIFTRSMLNKENKISAEKICFEAKRTFEYFLENSREDKISRILLSGGRVDEQFRKKICKGLQIETQVANSLEEIEVNTENKLEIVNNLNSYPVAIGLALISIHANHVSKLSSGFF